MAGARCEIPGSHGAGETGVLLFMHSIPFLHSIVGIRYDTPPPYSTAYFPLIDSIMKFSWFAFDCVAAIHPGFERRRFTFLEPYLAHIM